MLTLRQVASRLKQAEGAEIAEVALVLPLVFTFLLGILWFGRAYNIYSTIQQAAQQGAITAARDSCATCGNAPAAVTAVNAAITNVMQASHLDVNQIQLPATPPSCGAGGTAQACAACPSPPFPPPPSGGACSSTANIYLCQNVQLNPVAAGNPQTQPIQCGTVVSFQYPYQSFFPGTSLNMQKIILNAQAQSRMEN